MKSKGRSRLLAFAVIALLIGSAAVAATIHAPTRAHAASVPTGLQLSGIRSRTVVVVSLFHAALTVWVQSTRAERQGPIPTSMDLSIKHLSVLC